MKSLNAIIYIQIIPEQIGWTKSQSEGKFADDDIKIQPTSNLQGNERGDSIKPLEVRWEFGKNFSCPGIEMARQTDNQVRASWWIITLNNPTESDWSLIKALPPFVRFCKGQEEVGENGTQHIQAVANTSQVRLSQMKSWLQRAHFEVLKTKQHQKNACEYVWKDETAVEGTRFEVGVIEESPTTFDGIMLMIANTLIDSEEERPIITDMQIIEWAGTEKQISKKIRNEQEYQFATSEIIRENFALISYFARPDYLRTWVAYRDVILEKARLDRQTKITVT